MEVLPSTDTLRGGKGALEIDEADPNQDAGGRGGGPSCNLNPLRMTCVYFTTESAHALPPQSPELSKPNLYTRCPRSRLKIAKLSPPKLVVCRVN